MYIPKDWIKNKDNEEKIHELVEQLEVDVVEIGSKSKKEVIEQLKTMGETIIVEKIENNRIQFGA